MTAAPVDFVLHSLDANLMLLVEAKATDAPSQEWAARFARNLLENRRLPPNIYFLLVLRNYLYLWKHRPAKSTDLPDVSAKTEDVLAPYLVGMNSPLGEIDGTSFELLVRSWLLDLSEGSAPESVENWARAAGLQQFENGLIQEAKPN